MVIGRSSKTSDITLDAPNMPGLISRSHARIHIKRHFVTGTLLIHVEDMESTNGTFINGSEIYPLDVVSDSESENEPATYFSDDEEFTSDKKENEKKNENALEEEEESPQEVQRGMSNNFGFRVGLMKPITTIPQQKVAATSRGDMTGARTSHILGVLCFFWTLCRRW